MAAKQGEGMAGRIRRGNKSELAAGSVEFVERGYWLSLGGNGYEEKDPVHEGGIGDSVNPVQVYPEVIPPT